MFDFPSPFADQLSLFATHGILVSAHGAGLTNMIFLPPMASVIELFQVQHDHNLYSLLAMMMGIGHYPVHARNGSEMWATNTVSPWAVEGCPRPLFAAASPFRNENAVVFHNV